MRLRGRTCIVTGATRGLGGAIARRFYEEGGSLLLTGRDAGALQKLMESLVPISAEQKILAEVCDLSMPGAPSAIVSRAAEEFDSINVLVNNAATLGPIGPLWENDPFAWEETIRVNLLAPAALCGSVIPFMRRDGNGKIVNLSGGGATGPRPHFSAYAAAKAGLVRLTEILAHETRGMRIDINCVAPGMMRTRMLEEILAAGRDRAGADEYERAERCAAPPPPKALQRAVDLVLFLSSFESDGITGRLISALWDPWEELPEHQAILAKTDIYTLRRIVPKDRGLDWEVN